MDNRFLLLIDGSSLLSTQYFGNLPREILYARSEEEKEKYYHKIMMTSKGVYTNAVFGFLRTLFRILKDQRPEFLAVAWDLSRDTFRRELYPDYKANRGDTAEPLRLQYELCQNVLRELGIPQFMDDRFEADDFCGTLSKKFEDEVPVRIFTKDHDYLQLVSERTHMWLMHSSQEKTDEMYKKYRIDRSKVNVPDRAFELDPDLVLQEFGVTPDEVPALKGLQGDSSDNIKGVPGVGPQTAVRLIREYHTVEGLYEALKDLDKAKEDALKKDWKERLGIARSPLNFLLKESETELVGEKAARLSEELATIHRDIDLKDLKLKDLAVNVSREKAEKVLKDLEISTISADFAETRAEVPDIRNAFRIITDFHEYEDFVHSLLGTKCAGVCHMSGEGLALIREDGQGAFIRSTFFLTDRAFGDLLRGIQRSGISLYTTDGKEIFKIARVITDDVTVAAYLADPLKGSYPVEYLASQYLETDLSTLPKNGVFREEEDRALLSAWVSLQVHDILIEKLDELGMTKLYREIELPVMGVLARMEQAGIRVNRRALRDFGTSLSERIGVLEKEICELAGESFNINSPKQLGTILFDKLKLPYGKKTKSGYSTNADILDRLKDDHPIVAKVLEYRTYTKLRSTYAEGLISCISDDGRIHGTFNQTITATGRLSSTNPNLQNIPVRLPLGREIRKVFVPEDGCVFVDADYSQIELRILAHLSGDENLIGAYKDAKDIHALTASQVFGVPLEEVTKEMRSNAKAVNFGIVYGISAFSLSEDLSITRKEAQAYMDSYFATYPGVEKYLKDTVAEAKDKGYVRTLYGRVRWVPELSSMNFNQRSFGERVAMNSPIQGTAADIMKIAMIRVQEALRRERLKTRIVLQIHDELILEAPEEEAEQVKELLVREMEHAADLRVRLEVEAKEGRSWYETK